MRAGGGSLVDSARARIAEVFVEGADLPAPWDRATLLFASPTLAGPGLVFAKSAPGEAVDAIGVSRDDEGVVCEAASNGSCGRAGGWLARLPRRPRRGSHAQGMTRFAA